ncbi:hypothetical protein ACFLVB_02145, partial [Chloroflexota bacterium]
IKAKERKSLTLSVDIAEEQSVTDMAKKTQEVFPRIDILVNAHRVTTRRRYPPSFFKDTVNQALRVFRHTNDNVVGAGTAQSISTASPLELW